MAAAGWRNSTVWPARIASKRRLGRGAGRAGRRDLHCGQAALAPIVEHEIAAVEDAGDLPVPAGPKRHANPGDGEGRSSASAAIADAANNPATIKGAHPPESEGNGGIGAVLRRELLRATDCRL